MLRAVWNGVVLAEAARTVRIEGEPEPAQGSSRGLFARLRGAGRE